MPMDPAGKFFGFGVTRLGSAIGGFSVLDSLVTSGPNSWGSVVSGTTWLAGWTPLGPVTPAIQLFYDFYTLNRIEMRNRR